MEYLYLVLKKWVYWFLKVLNLNREDNGKHFCTIYNVNPRKALWRKEKIAGKTSEHILALMYKVKDIYTYTQQCTQPQKRFIQIRQLDSISSM